MPTSRIYVSISVLTEMNIKERYKQIYEGLTVVVTLLFISFAGYAQEATDSIGDALVFVPDSVAIEMPDSIEHHEVRKLPRPNRTITPVDIDDDKPQTVLHYYDKHGDPRPEPVMFLATLDTVVAPKSKPGYPLYNGVSVGVNFADAIFMAA